jgi:hypothetical protein
MTYLLLILFSLNLFAQDTLLILCHPNISQTKLLSSLKSFATKNDKLSLSNSGCIEIFTTIKKEDLFTRLAKLKYPQIQIKSTSYIASDKKLCRIKIEKIVNNGQQLRYININKRSKLGETDNKSASSEISNLLVSNAKSGSISINGSTYKLLCHYRNKNLYDISITATSEDSAISTNLSLAKGQRIEIGSSLKKINDGDTNIGIPTGIVHRKKSGDKLIKIYLSISQI